MTADIGARIRDLRRARGLSQEDVSRRTNIGLKTYSRLEQGRTKDPHYSTLLEIARALDVPVEDLVREPSLTGRAEAQLAESQGHLERQLEYYFASIREEVRRAQLDMVRSWVGYADDRATYYEQKLERGRMKEYATFNGALHLAVLAIDEFALLYRRLFQEPARPLWIAFEHGVGLEVQEEYNVLILHFLLDRITRTQHVLIENAEALAETREQKDELAAKRQRVDDLHKKIARRVV